MSVQIRNWNSHTMMKARLFQFVLWFSIAAASFLGTAAAQPVLLEVQKAEAAFDRRTNEPVVTFWMTDASQKVFAEFTAKHVGRPMALIVDGRVITKPIIREPIIGGQGQIAGNFTVEDAKALAERLSSGKARIEIEAE